MLSSRRLGSWLLFLLMACGVIAVGETYSGSLERQAHAAGRTREPLDGIEALIAARKHSEAQTALRQARQIYRSSRDQHGEAICLLLLGIGELRAANLSAATADLNQAGASLTALGDRFGAWIAEWMLGSLKAGAGQFEAARIHFERAFASLRQAPGSRDPFGLRTLRYAHSSLLLPDDVATVLRSEHSIVSPTLIHFLEAMSRDGYVWILVLSGRLVDAEAEVSQLAEFSRRLGGRFDSLVEAHRGELRRKQGRLGEARESFGRALDGASSLPPAPFRDEWPELQLLDHLVEIELLSGRCEEALAWSDKALGRLRIRDAANGRFSVLVRVNRAGVFTKCGRLAEAEAALSEALGIARQDSHVYLQATTATQLGRLLAEPGRRFEEAARHLEAAVGLFQRVDAPLDEVKAWLLLSECYANLEAYDLAGATLEKARELAAKRDIPWVAEIIKKIADLQHRRRDLAAGKNLERLLEVLNNLRVAEELDSSFPGLFLEGYLRLKRGEVAAARNLWNIALKRSPNRELEAYLQAAIGVSYWAEGKIETALPYFDRAVGGVEATIGEVRIGELLTSLLGGPKQGFFEALVEMLAQQKRPREAFEYAERARARAFLQGLGNPRLTLPQGADPKLAREVEEVRKHIIALQRQEASTSAADQERLSSELAKARERYQSLLVRLKVIYRDETPWNPIEPQSIPAIRQQLGRETSLVSYFISSSQIHAWVLDQEELRHVTLPLDPQGLRWAVCWADQFERRRRSARIIDSHCGADLARAEEIYAKLIAPLRGFIRHRRLIVIPHGELHYLPFAALRDPQTGRYFVEHFTLTYAPSASAIGFLRSKETAVEGEALILGPPEGPGSSPLPAARREAVLVGRLFGTRAWIGTEAMEEVLYQRSKNVDLLHIAAHGIYESRSPLFSHIALAPDKEHDGNLEVHEILSDLDLSGVNLVVLSACETARGERSRGDEITSLTRAFLYAGSPGVLSTLWSIDDEAAAVLMGEFYTSLLAGASAADALRQAQLALLRSPLYSHPRFWAAFSLAGDPQGKWTQSHRKVKP